MYPTLRDRVTGVVKCCPDWDASVYWWTEGNGSCDCNRAIAMGSETPEDVCGTARYLALAVHGDLEGWTAQDIVAMMNDEYELGDVRENTDDAALR